MSRHARETDMEALLDRGSVTPKGGTAEYGFSRTWFYNEMREGRLEYIQVTPRKRLIARTSIQRRLAEIKSDNEQRQPAA